MIAQGPGQDIELFGWTGDSQRFEHCHPSGGRGGFDCESHGVDDLAAEAYHAAGLAALRNDDLPGAIDGFAAATSLSIAWKGPYNLACARARADAPDAEAALREAIRRGGDTVRTKARTDDDLASVRHLSWFTNLVGA